MKPEPLLYSVRAAVAVAFLLSAWWKMRNQSEFRAVFRASAPRRLQRFARRSAYSVAAVEILVAGVVLTPGDLGQLSAGVAFVLIALFTTTLLRADNPTLGCGCWRSSPDAGDPALRRKLFLVRNAVLASFAVIAAAGELPFDAGSLSFGLAVGSLLAIVVMEIPEIGVVATTERRGEV